MNSGIQNNDLLASVDDWTRCVFTNFDGTDASWQGVCGLKSSRTLSVPSTNWFMCVLSGHSIMIALIFLPAVRLWFKQSCLTTQHLRRRFWLRVQKSKFSWSLRYFKETSSVQSNGSRERERDRGDVSRVRPQGRDTPHGRLISARGFSGLGKDLGPSTVIPVGEGMIAYGHSNEMRGGSISNVLTQHGLRRASISACVGAGLIGGGTSNTVSTRNGQQDDSARIRQPSNIDGTDCWRKMPDNDILYSDNDHGHHSNDADRSDSPTVSNHDGSDSNSNSNSNSSMSGIGRDRRRKTIKHENGEDSVNRGSSPKGKRGPVELSVILSAGEDVQEADSDSDCSVTDGAEVQVGVGGDVGEDDMKVKTDSEVQAQVQGWDVDWGDTTRESEIDGHGHEDGQGQGGTELVVTQTVSEGRDVIGDQLNQTVIVLNSVHDQQHEQQHEQQQDQVDVKALLSTSFDAFDIVDTESTILNDMTPSKNNGNGNGNGNGGGTGTGKSSWLRGPQLSKSKE